VNVAAPHGSSGSGVFNSEPNSTELIAIVLNRFKTADGKRDIGL
jgi:hypothetical protein